MPRWGWRPLVPPKSLWCSESSAQGAHQGLTASGPTAGSPQAPMFPIHTPSNSHLSPKQLGHIAATRKAIWLNEASKCACSPSSSIACIALFVSLKKSLYLSQILNKGMFQDTHFGEGRPTTKIGKSFKERTSSQSTCPTTVRVTHSPNMSVCFWIRVLSMPQGLWSSSQCSSGDGGEGFAGGWVWGYLMFGNCF